MFAGEQEDAAAAVALFGPEEGELGEGGFEGFAIVADFHQQYAARIEEAGGVLEDLAGGVEAVFATAECHFGLVQIFGGQGGNAFGIYIRGVGDDEVVSAGQIGEEVALNQADALF